MMQSLRKRWCTPPSYFHRWKDPVMGACEAEASLWILGIDKLNNWAMMGSGNNWRGHRKGTDLSWEPGGLIGETPVLAVALPGVTSSWQGPRWPLFHPPLRWVRAQSNWAGQNSVCAQASSPGARNLKWSNRPSPGLCFQKKSLRMTGDIGG